MTSSSKPPLAWIGAGIMGLPMAGHLLSAGYPLAVYTRTAARARPLIEKGARQATSPADAAADAQIVFICVNDTPDVEAVLFAPGGVEEAAKKRPGLVIVDHSTISPTATQSFAERLAKHGATLIDAPVSGGDAGAKAGTLSIMCGGFFGEGESGREGEWENKTANRASGSPPLRHSPTPTLLRELLSTYGKTITYCGGSGSGQLTKLVNQVLVAVTNLAVAEAVTFAETAGLDPQATLAAVGGGAAGSWQLANQGPKMFAGDFAPGFMIDLQQKDLRLVLDYAREKRLPLLATSLVHQLLAAAQAHGRGREGTQALVSVLRELAARRKE